jgi:hypothetical protein
VSPQHNHIPQIYFEIPSSISKYPLTMCLDGERISVRITLFGLVVEKNVRKVLIFTILG